MDTRQKNHAMAFRLSLSALMAALGTVLMLSSNLIPVLTYVAPMLASLTLIPILTEFGKKYAWMTWGVTAGLALLLCADREAAFFYLFIGWYPILKPKLDRIPSRPVRILSKLALFTAVFAVFTADLRDGPGRHEERDASEHCGVRHAGGHHADV